jgi:hypothetical protein
MLLYYGSITMLQQGNACLCDVDHRCVELSEMIEHWLARMLARATSRYGF